MIWHSYCPVGLASIDKAVLDGLSGLEIYNSHFTSKAGEWALGFCADIVGADNPCSSVESTLLGSIEIIDLSDRCIHKLPEVSNDPNWSSTNDMMHFSTLVLTISLSLVFKPLGILS